MHECKWIESDFNLVYLPDITGPNTTLAPQAIVVTDIPRPCKIRSSVSGKI